jgi:hypothetical protein
LEALFKRELQKSLGCNCMVVKDIMILHNLKGMPFYDIAQNLMAISAYSMKTPHR